MQSHLTPNDEEEYLPDFGNADKSNPFVVPDNYFSTLRIDTLKKIEGIAKQTEVQTFTFSKYAKIAAVICLFILGGASIFIITKQNSTLDFKQASISFDDIPMEEFDSRLLEETYASVYLSSQKEDENLTEYELLLLEFIDEKTLTEQL